MAAAEITLNLIVVAGKIKYQFSFMRTKHQASGKACPAFKQVPAEFANRKAGMRVRIAKAFFYLIKGGNDRVLAAGLPDDLFKSFRELNGNHFCCR
jgi:hypothetical protein